MAHGREARVFLEWNGVARPKASGLISEAVRGLETCI